MEQKKSLEEVLRTSKVKSFDGKTPFEVYQEYKDTIPFPIIDFANRFGVRIFSKKLDNNVSGMICNNKITINSDDNPRRQFFTAAHELSHFLLGHGDKSDYIYRKNSSYSYNDRQNEIEANNLAGEFLMPSDIFISLFKKYEKESYNFYNIVSKLALEFGVSESAVMVRLEVLNCVDKTQLY